MRIAVIGGTGGVGRHTVAAAERAGHETVVVSRSRGVDVTTGEGLAGALAGVDAVIDVTNLQADDVAATQDLFARATQNLLAAEETARVKHHVLLSIVGVDLIVGNAHYAGKRTQERLVAEGRVPWTIQRATQFHDFPTMVTEWLTQGDRATIPPALIQPVAPADVGEVLVEIAAGKPHMGRAPDLAGPEPQDFVDMARRTLAMRGRTLRLVPSWRNGVFDLEAAGEMLLPGPGARLAPTTFDAWLAAEGERRDR
jgi:uncharacterized protein YbjT (DUF2867 family)